MFKPWQAIGMQLDPEVNCCFLPTLPIILILTWQARYKVSSQARSSPQVVNLWPRVLNIICIQLQGYFN